MTAMLRKQISKQTHTKREKPLNWSRKVRAASLNRLGERAASMETDENSPLIIHRYPAVTLLEKSNCPAKMTKQKTLRIFLRHLTEMEWRLCLFFA